MEVGSVYWVEPPASRAYVGRVIEITPLTIVLGDAVTVHQHGVWELFQVGVFETRGGTRAHVSACLEPMTLSRFGSSCLWRGDLDALRAWAKQ